MGIVTRAKSRAFVTRLHIKPHLIKQTEWTAPSHPKYCQKKKISSRSSSPMQNQTRGERMTVTNDPFGGSIEVCNVNRLFILKWMCILGFPSLFTHSWVKIISVRAVKWCLHKSLPLKNAHDYLSSPKFLLKTLQVKILIFRFRFSCESHAYYKMISDRS